MCHIHPILQVAVLRLLKQLSEVYSTMRITTLAELVPFMPFSEVEGVVVDAVKSDYLQVSRSAYSPQCLLSNLSTHQCIKKFTGASSPSCFG